MNINTETPLTDQLGKLGMPIGTFVKLEDCQRIEKAFHQKCQEVRDLKARLEELKSEKSAWIQHAARLTAIGDQIIEDGSVIECLFNEWNEAKK